MIISASYKTDIPTFYGEWFIHRLNAGYCKMVNPYSRQVYRVDLTPEHVDGFVFWTKNIGPFLSHLKEIPRRGYPFYIQHTVNGYSHELESRVIDAQRSVEHMKYIAGEYGPKHLVWRYDPVIFSSLTPVDWHRKNFALLASHLEGTTDEVVISFAQLYKKTERNIDMAASKFGFSWEDHKREDHVLQQGRQLITEFAQVAASHGMCLKICSQKAFLLPGVTQAARCIDADRLEKIAGHSLKTKTIQKGNRKECGCFTSNDIGEYDTCPHGCMYCYAVHHRERALTRYKAHDPQSEFLFPPTGFLESQPQQDQIKQSTPIIKPQKPLKILKDIQEKQKIVQQPELFE